MSERPSSAPGGVVRRGSAKLHRKGSKTSSLSKTSSFKDKKRKLSTSGCQGATFKLDGTTAHRDLHVSKDGMTVYYTPGTAENRGNEDAADIGRFYDVPYSVNAVILGDLQVARGRHYWEVSVGNSTLYRVGVAFRTTPREECLGENDSSWALSCSSHITAKHDCINDDVKVTSRPVQIGVYLDCDIGTLSFFDAGRRKHLYSFHSHFKEPVAPAFAVWNGSLTVTSGKLDVEYAL